MSRLVSQVTARGRRPRGTSLRAPAHPLALGAHLERKRGTPCTTLASHPGEKKTRWAKPGGVEGDCHVYERQVRDAERGCVEDGQAVLSSARTATRFVLKKSECDVAHLQPDPALAEHLAALLEVPDEREASRCPRATTTVLSPHGLDSRPSTNGPPP